ncbi:MAG: ammonium transporter [Planctomycetes bacterium]|nr:ammonium transporter [Planctomycetota bacterium]
MIRLLIGSLLLLTSFCPIVVGQDAAAPVAETADAAAIAATPAPETPPPAVSTLNSGDQAWVLASAAFVLLMTPGLAFFYGGLVGRKNVLSILMQCFVCMGVITVLWVTVGYSMFYGDDVLYGFCGNPMQHFLLEGITTTQAFQPVPNVPLGISQQTFMVFQMMFAIITPGLIIGAFAERMKFVSFTLFIALWSLLVYCPVAHWVWFGPSNFPFNLGSFSAKDAVPEGALDFAGGTVVHINAGIAALVACLMIGPRRGYPHQITPPHNLPFAVLGAGLLWFGWFGFNGGSAFGATPQAVQAFVTTQVAAATAGLLWSIIEMVRNGKPTALGMITGVVAGLVGITPAAGFVDVKGALIIGAGATIISYIFVAYVKPALKYDDSLDVFGVHGMAGIFGALATGFLATGEFGVDRQGGSMAQFMLQLKAVVTTIIYSGVVTFILLKVIDLAIGLRCTEDSEKMGLDLSDHAETAYTIS